MHRAQASTGPALGIEEIGIETGTRQEEADLNPTTEDQADLMARRGMSIALPLSDLRYLSLVPDAKRGTRTRTGRAPFSYKPPGVASTFLFIWTIFAINVRMLCILFYLQWELLLKLFHIS